jgi:hypothetical protein
MVRYYGYYSNRARGDRKKTGKDDEVPALMEPEVSSKEFRRRWAQLIQKVYSVDPLVCPRCQGVMKIISFIGGIDVIEKILRHIGLWEIHNHGPPVRNSTYVPELTYDDDYSQVPSIDYWLQ